jgi:hypothetical protein
LAGEAKIVTRLLPSRNQIGPERPRASPQGLRPEIKRIIEALARDAVVREDREREAAWPAK